MRFFHASTPASNVALSTPVGVRWNTTPTKTVSDFIFLEGTKKLAQLFNFAVPRLVVEKQLQAIP
jgi:hypothetical protein